MKKSIFISLFLVIILLFNISVSFGMTHKQNNAINEDWYEIENQPDEALNIVELWIGKKTYTVNGISKESDVAPVIRNSRTLVPIRVISEGLGAIVTWDGAEKKVTIQLETLDGNKTVELFIGKKSYYIDGIMYEMDVPPQIINSRTMVPIRVVSESLNCKVFWDGTEKRVTVKAINLQSDADFDSLTFEQEYQYGTDPNNPDTDDDGLNDDMEVNGWDVEVNNKTIHYTSNPTKLDTDNDGLTDGQEYKYKTNPNNPDTDGDRVSDGDEVKYHLNPLRDYSNPFSLLIHDKDYIPISGTIEKITNNNEALNLFKKNIRAINNIKDENDRISVLTKFLRLIDSILNDKAELKSLEELIGKYSVTNIDKVEKLLNKQKKANELINSFYKNKDEKLKENFLQFLYPKLIEENPENIDDEVNSFFSFVSSLPDELKTYELNTFLFFEDGKVDDNEKAFINAYIKDKDDKTNTVLAKKVIDSYLDKIPQDDPNRDKFINEIKTLPAYANMDTENALSSVESLEDIISLYLEGKPYKNFEDRFNNSSNNNPGSPIVIDGKINDWKSLGLKPVIKDSENDESNAAREDCDITDVYAMIQGGYLYIALETAKPIDKDASFIFPIDTNGDGDWDYSIGFNKDFAWFYNLKDYPNGKWPDKSIDITSMSEFAVSDAAEIKVNLSGFLTNTTRIQSWINVKGSSNNWETVDETGMSDNIPVISMNNNSVKTESEDEKKHDVWEGFDLILRGGNPYKEREKELRMIKNIYIDGKVSDWVDIEPLKIIHSIPPENNYIEDLYCIGNKDYVFLFFKTKNKPSKNQAFSFTVLIPPEFEKPKYRVTVVNNAVYVWDNYYTGKSRAKQVFNVKFKLGNDGCEIKVPLNLIGNPQAIKIYPWTYLSKEDKVIDELSMTEIIYLNINFHKFNTTLFSLYNLSNKYEFKKFDTIPLAIALSNSYYISYGDESVIREVIRDEIDLMSFAREVSNWQDEMKYQWNLENYPLEAQIAWAWRGNSTMHKGSPLPYSLYSLQHYKIPGTLNSNAYEGGTVSVKTLRSMLKASIKLNWNSEDVNKIVENIEEYFVFGYQKHWEYPNWEDPANQNYYTDSNGAEIGLNVDENWGRFINGLNPQGDCGGVTSMVDAILKSMGVASLCTWRYILKESIPPIGGHSGGMASHAIAIYYDPLSETWKGYSKEAMSNWPGVEESDVLDFQIFIPPVRHFKYSNIWFYKMEEIKGYNFYLWKGNYFYLIKISVKNLYETLTKGIQRSVMKKYIYSVICRKPF